MDERTGSAVREGRFFGAHVARIPGGPIAGHRAYVVLEICDAEGRLLLEHGLCSDDARRLIGLLAGATKYAEGLRVSDE